MQSQVERLVGRAIASLGGLSPNNKLKSFKALRCDSADTYNF